MPHGHKESEEYIKDNKSIYKREGIETYVEQDYVTYRAIQNDCRGFNNLSYTIHLR